MIRPTYDFVLQIVGEARELGYEQLPDGAQVFGRVPHVAPLAWLHKVYPPLHEDEIALLEARLKRPVPDAYRSWLRCANGLNVFSGEFVLYGRRTDYSRQPSVVQPFDLDVPNVLERLHDADRDAFFIGSALGAEYLLYLLPQTGGGVYACSRRSAKPLASWESLATVVATALAAFRNAFDSKGREIRRLELHDLARTASS